MNYKHNDDASTSVLSAVIGLMLGLLFVTAVTVLQIRDQLRKEFQYQLEYDMCQQKAWQYDAVCHVEQDDNKTYHWSFNQEEN